MTRPSGPLRHLLGAVAMTLLLSPVACSGAAPQADLLFPELAGPPAADACNGDPELCDRRYDAVAYPTTHNAMSASDMGFWSANQRGSISRQLQDGIRALMLDTHTFTLRPGDKRPWLCHKFCLLGGMPLVDGLREVRAFMDGHPREIITIILESHAPADRTRDAFAQSGLLELAHVQRADRPWPTLRELIGTGRRLVVFTDQGGGKWPWFHDEFAFVFENPFAAWRDTDFACGVDRGLRAGLFVLNHFISAPLPDRAASARVNRAASLWAHVRRCTREQGRQPNFVTVDYYDVGDLFAVVKRINRPGPTVAAR